MRGRPRPAICEAIFRRRGIIGSVVLFHYAISSPERTNPEAGDGETPAWNRENPFRAIPA